MVKARRPPEGAVVSSCVVCHQFPPPAPSKCNLSTCNCGELCGSRANVVCAILDGVGVVVMHLQTQRQGNHGSEPEIDP